MKKTKKCSVCCVVRSVAEFKRKGKLYKSCNRCSQYKKKYANSKKLVEPSMVLNKIFTSCQELPQQFHQKYEHIKKLEKELINEIYECMKKKYVDK